MLSFQEVKDLCKEHDECLFRTKMVNRVKKEDGYIKILDDQGNEFNLTCKEIDLLDEVITKRGMEIEGKIRELLQG